MHGTRHSRIGPSRAGRMVQCPGSVQMQEQYPGPDTSDEAEEGHVVHRYSSAILDGHRKDEAPAIPPEPMDDSMLDAAIVYVDDVLKVLRSRYIPFSRLMVEYPVSVPSVHTDMWGTLDAAVLDMQQYELVVWDFKYGWGLIDEWENWQGICYGLGLLHLYGPSAAPKRIHFRVVQPRPYCTRGRVRQWSVNTSDMPLYEAQLKDAAEKALGHAPPLHTGRYCRDCTALLYCPAAEKTTMLAVEIGMTYGSIGMDASSMSRELDILKRAAEIIKHRSSVLEEKLIHLLKTGTSVPGWMLDKAPGKTTWSRPVQEVLTLGKMFGVNLGKDEVITPTQARKLKVIPDALIDTMISTGSSLKLIKDDGRMARQVFGGK